MIRNPELTWRAPSISPMAPTILVAFFTEELKERVENINNYITFSLYCNVCRSLFEKHKLMFAFLVSARILMNEGRIDMVSRSP